MPRFLKVPRFLRRAVRNGFNALGYEVVRFPVHYNTLWDHLKEIIGRQRVDCVIDVGAHFGEYATQLRRLGYRGRIVSFEPVAANFEQLAERAKGDPLWTCHPFALSDQDERRSLQVTNNSLFSSLLKPNDYSLGWSGEGSSVARTETVTTRRLDSLDLRDSIIDPGRTRVLLKVDAQGHDPAVVDGAQGILPWVCALQSEVSVRPLYHGMLGYRECIARYEALGFELTGLFPCAAESDQRVIEFDCVMIRS